MWLDYVGNLYIRLCGNKLKFSICKTNRDEYELKIRNDAIQRVSIIKYLGIMINDHLSFDDNLKYITTKISRKIGIMARSIKLVNKNYKIKVYNSVILPHFAFCASILFLLNATQMDRIQKLQNRAYYFDQEL